MTSGSNSVIFTDFALQNILKNLYNKNLKMEQQQQPEETEPKPIDDSFQPKQLTAVADLDQEDGPLVRKFSATVSSLIINTTVGYTLYTQSCFCFQK